ncbi:MAG: hypothetical protein ACI4QM_00870, partial [Alphaproteobacteria bacterium]
TEQARFFNTFYLNGLGEFSVRNRVQLSIDFPYDASHKSATAALTLAPRTLVPVGGGKDSCVTMELLKKEGMDITAFSVGTAQPIVACIRTARLPHLALTRHLSDELLRLNAAKTVYNGHVPITGLIAFLLWICGILYDYKYVAMSCERSADSPNLIQNGLKINHQYSKSIDFEKDFYALTREITPDFRYFSLLRPLSELHIGKLFATLCMSYFDVFTSCNKAFKLDENQRLSGWCGACDKCRFVFLILAPFMQKEQLVSLMGGNLLDNAEHLTGYAELLGLSGHKPFECVGETAECRYAFSLLAHHPHWQQDRIIRAFADKFSQNQEALLTPSSNHFIPEFFNHVMARFSA